MNYTDIVAAAKAYADRIDAEVSDNIDVFILMAESKINRILKTRDQSTRAFITAVELQEFYPLPTDYAGMRNLQYNSEIPTSSTSQTHSYDYMTPVLFNERRNQPFGGKFYYTVIADQLQIFPALCPDQTLEMIYYQKVPNLNSESVTNWLSDNYPDIYISGIVSEIEFFVKNYEVGDAWQQRLNAALDELKSSDIEERWSGAPLLIKGENNVFQSNVSANVPEQAQ